MTATIELWHEQANIGKRIMRFDRAGDSVPMHFHNFAHVIYCVRGSVRLLAFDEDGKLFAERTLAPGDSETILANCTHKATALEDGSEAHCIFAHRTPQGQVVQQYAGFDEAYANRDNPPTPRILAALAREVDTHGNDGY